MPFNIQNKEENQQAPFGLLVQKGLVEDFTAYATFGYNSEVGTSFETVWSGGGLYAYPTTATTATVASSDTVSDNGGTVDLYGLNANWVVQSERVTIGQTSTNTWLRIFSATLVNANTGNANVGTITVTVNAIAVATILPTYGKSLSCVYTVPANSRAFILSTGVGVSKQKEIEAKLMIRRVTDGNAYNTIGYQTLFGGNAYQEFPIPILIDQKTDIEIRAKADATTAVSASIALYIEEYH
jgi:hypothetical protein